MCDIDQAGKLTGSHTDGVAVRTATSAALSMGVGRSACLAYVTEMLMKEACVFCSSCHRDADEGSLCLLYPADDSTFAYHLVPAQLEYISALWSLFA